MQILLYLLGILAVCFVIALSIGLHEMGHLLFAKAFGIKVERYMIGFGPTLFSFQKGETEYGLKLIPLGGYVAISGMYPGDEESFQGVSKKSFALENSEKNENSGRRTEKLNIFSKKIKQLIKDAKEGSNGSLGENEKHKAFYNKKTYQKLLVMFGGPLANIVLGAFFYILLISCLGVTQSSNIVEYVQICQDSSDACSASEQTPAYIAGLKSKDEIIAVNDIETHSGQDVQEAISDLNANAAAKFAIKREGNILTLNISPFIKTDSDGNQKSYIGIALGYDNYRLSPLYALKITWENIIGVIEVIFDLPNRLYEAGVAAFGNADRSLDSPISIVGVARLSGEITQSSDITNYSKLQTVVSLSASLNIALAVFNLIPLLPLDGGHIVAALYEKLRKLISRLKGKEKQGYFDSSRLMPLTIIVFGLFILMSALLIYADIVKPIGIF